MNKKDNKQQKLTIALIISFLLLSIFSLSGCFRTERYIDNEIRKIIKDIKIPDKWVSVDWDKESITTIDNDDIFIYDCLYLIHVKYLNTSSMNFEFIRFIFNSKTGEYFLKGEYE